MSFSIYTQVCYLLWILMFLVWMIGRISNKRTVKKHAFSIYIFTTVFLYLSYLILFLPYFSRTFPLQVTPQNWVFGLFGVLLCLLGVGFAIWSRYTLGKNWSGIIVTQKENHDLIKTGPYTIVRHPIYLGFIVAMFGFALTIGNITSYVAVVLEIVTLLMRIFIEEKLMNQIFSNSYQVYSLRTKRLIPFVW